MNKFIVIGFSFFLGFHFAEAQEIAVDSMSIDQEIDVSEGESQTIQLDGQSSLALSGGTKIKLKSKDDTPEFELLSGTIRGKVQKKLESKKTKLFIRTRSAVMGVRGTEFIVEQSPGSKDAEFYTLDGEVLVGSSKNEIIGGKGTLLKKGFQMRGPGRLGKPKRFNRAKVMKRFMKRHPGLFKRKAKKMMREKSDRIKDSKNLRRSFEEEARGNRRQKIRDGMDRKRPRVDRQRLRKKRLNKMPPPPGP